MVPRRVRGESASELTGSLPTQFGRYRVIKPLGSYLKKVVGVAGSTIMGDGRVIMILDVAELVNMLKKQAPRRNGAVTGSSLAEK